MADVSLYSRDFYTWTQDQAERLRALAGDNRVDAENLAEEIADLGRSELNRVHNNLVNALVNLLEAAWLAQAQPQMKWRGEAHTFLRHARRAFTPGMRQHLDIAAIHADAVAEANARLTDHGDPVLPALRAPALSLAELLDADLDLDALRRQARAQLLDAGARRR